MKKFITLFTLLTISLFFLNCTSDEKVEGTVEGNNLEVVTLEGSIASDATFAITDQDVPVVITLPKSFADTVKVEVSSFSDTGRRRRTYIDVMPNQTTINDFATAAGGADGVYSGSSCTFQLTGIALQTVEIGKHYLIKSNVLNIATGDFSAPTENSSKLQIRLNWLYPDDNNYNLIYKRPTTTVSGILSGASSSGTTVNVSSTSELAVGMVVKVASGVGNFNSNSVITAINSATSFSVNRPILVALNNASIIGYGNDYNDNTASSSGTTVTVNSTTGLYKGMILHVTGGTGKFALNAVVSNVLSSTTFTVSNNPSVALSNATIMASFPDAICPLNGGLRSHDITISGTSNLAGTSSIIGDYVFKIAPVSLLPSTVNLPYRLVIVKPNGEVEVFNGVYNNITLSSPLLDVLKINKTGDGESAVFTATNLNP